MMKKTLAALATGAVLGGTAVGLAMGYVTPGTASTSDTFRMLNLFGDVFERVRTDYVTEVGDSDLIEGAIDGMLTSLDPHSSYLDADTFRDMQVQTRGEFGGLGIEVTMEEGLVKVVSPIDDTPASRAGLEAGDYISHIDGEAIMGLTLNEAIKKMRGPVGTSIDITVLRGEEEPFQVSLTRDIIELQSVRSRIEGDDIGYLRVTTFNEKAESGLIDAIEEMKTKLPNAKGYILDLRNNPGGLLEQAVSVTSIFLDGGEVVSTRSRDPQDTDRYTARRGDIIDGKPLVVLINQGSASASEIVAGALQDHGRAQVLGMRSFGKGSVQTIIPLGGGTQGALRLTTSRYYTPSGRSIQAFGIVPDIEVLPKGYEAPDDGITRGEAGLPGHLSEEQAEDHSEYLDHGITQAPVDTEVEDYQLQRALEILRGVEADTAMVAEPVQRRIEIQ